MSGKVLTRSASLVLAVAMVSPPLLAGCAALASRNATATFPEVHRSAPTQFAIAQVRHRGEARFEVCPVDACPRPTTKTLAGRAQALVAAPPLAVSSSDVSLRVDASSPAKPSLTSPTPQLEQETITPPIAVRTIVVTFASGSALLTAAARQQLEAIVSDAQRVRAIEIRGRTDELGSAALNDVLARNRAFAVRDYLRTHELPEATTIRLSSKGACCYVAGNDTTEGRAANRRVEIEWQPDLQLAKDRS